MLVRSKSRLPLLAAGLAVSALTATTMADISETVFEITATNDLGTATYRATFADGYYDPTTQSYDWSLAQPVVLMSQTGIPIARLGTASVHCEDDPVVGLNFSVFAGSLMTTFTITSPTLSFGAIAQAEGRASAGITISDLDGDGVTYVPTNGGTGGYIAQYNGSVPTGTTFANLQATPFGSVIPGDTVGRAEEFPGAGLFLPIVGAVSDMSSRFRFTLSANDISSGTSIWETREIPAPGAMALLGLGGLIAARRRR